ncbi:type I restriction enzyme S subunit [Gelidibacter algens]|uniref:Type I restriction enzyme S subunit n=1 Tax=Gelidibacter algens TaxID=49280 RepID=A0A1A7R5N8_9FLAO|nr:restriction endonuclease subunit S [Gelidibacter algens]OBX26818.1 restriction endonuclease subunit S [Gelidibacter algens]RAJ22732.1 type I restriction enzyme S subunit [Gelidibacter algens]
MNEPKSLNITITKQSVSLIPELRFKEFDGEWKKKKLSDLTKINQGLQIAISERFTEPFAGSQFYITNEVLRAGSAKKYFIKNAPKSVLCVEDDILMTRTGNTGQVVTGVKGAFHNNFFKIKLDSLLDKWFMYYFLTDYKTQHSILKLAGTSTIPDLNHGDFYRLKINLPQLPEQQKIATFLTAIDRKLQQLNTKKTLLEHYKKGVMQQLFSQKLRFKDDDGKDYGDWEEQKLGDISSNISYGMNAAATTYDGQNKYLRITDIDEFSNGLNVDKLTSPNGLLEVKFRVKEGDILFARTGASVGKSYLYRLPDGILYFAGFLIRFHIKEALPAFVYLQTQTSKYNKWVKIMSMRSGQPGINAEEYKTFKILLPCKEEQQKIANYLSAIDSKIETITQQIDKTQAFKKGLLQGMFV